MPSFGPLSSSPLSALASPGVLSLSESILFGINVPKGVLIKTAKDSLVLSDSDAAQIIKTLKENIALSGSPLGNTQLHTQLTDSVKFAEALRIGWKILVSDGIVLSGTVAGNPTRVAAIIDSLHMTGLVTTRLDAMAVIAEIIAISDLLARGWQVSAIDTVAFTEALAASIGLVKTLLDTAVFSDTAGDHIRITAVMADSIAIAATDAATMHMYSALSDQVLFYTVLRLGGAEYSGWVLNDGAPSQYTNYPYNGFVNFGGHWYGTSDKGLDLLEGVDDSGTAINSFIRTALMDFGTGKFKRVPEVFIAFAGANKVVIKATTTDENGLQTTDIYHGTLPPGSSLRNGRVKLGRGLESVYWQFEIGNDGGGAQSYDALSFHPLFLDRRL